MVTAGLWYYVLLNLLFAYILALFMFDKVLLSLQVRVWGAVTYRRLGHIPLIPECSNF